MSHIHVFFTLASEIVELLLAGWQVSVTLLALIIAIGILEFRLFTVAVLALEVWVGLISCFIAAVNADGMRL